MSKPDPSPTPPAHYPFSSESVSNRTLFRWMLRWLRPVAGLAVVCASLLILYVSLEAYQVNLMGKAVTEVQQLAAPGSAQPVADAARREASIDSLIAILLTWTGIVVFQLFLRFVREVMNNRFSMHGVYYIREAVYDRVQRLGLGFHDAISSGQLINRALTDLQNVRNFVQNSLMAALDIVVGVMIYIALIYSKSPWIGLIALVPLPIWTIYIMRFSKRVQPAQKAVMETDDKNVSIITENIAGVHVVKAFATEKQEIGRYNDNADEFKRRVLRRIRLFANFHPVIRAIASASHLSLFLVASIIIVVNRGDSMKVGDLMVLGGAMGAILGRLQGIAGINEQYQNAIVSARRLYEILEARETIPESADSRPLPPGSGKVEFRNVTFGYSPAKPVLHDISFTVPAGQVVAIVGPTGSGKSTLVNLVARFYEPQSGRVLIDDVDIKTVSLDSLRTQVSFVFQETYLFSDSVTANIAYGRPKISAGDIEAAARLAQAHEFIEQLPKGYDTLLGERGTTLSGGQRQRLAIARAIVTNPRILILDDATAAIDSQTEDLIRRGMDFVMMGRTTFIIAHRISTVQRADLLLVVENGRITQQGTHEQLLNEPGHYREVALAQLARDESDEESPSHVKRMRDEKKVAAAVKMDVVEGAAASTDAST